VLTRVRDSAVADNPNAAVGGFAPDHDEGHFRDSAAS
jgi:hypothetical protein